MSVNKNSILYLGSILLISLGLNFYSLFKILKTKAIKNNFFETTKVNRVIDGDTFDIENGVRIRLYEVNAPEYPKDCLGVDAKTRMEDLILSKIISLDKIGKDNFGRTLAYVYLDKLSINETMAEEGLAYFEKGKTMTENSLIIEQSQEKAKSAGRGVWSSFCQTKKEGCLIKGNYRPADNTRIYHTPDCYNYDRITIKPGTTDRWFCDENEAKIAGFRKSLD